MHKDERREGYAEISGEFFDKLAEHMVEEDAKFEAGALRMERIETDLRPIKNMYWAIVGSAAIGTLLLGLLIYIYATDKNDFKEVQRAIIIQGEAIQKLMVSQSNLEQSYHRDVERIERGQDRLLNQADRKDERAKP